MAIKFLSGQTISGTLTVSGNVQGATFNGLAINTTGLNNVANQIVRTQANGYVNFGWINSVSGNHTGAITRITASNDAYLRYVTPAQFRTGVTDGFYAPSSTVTGVTSVTGTGSVSGLTLTGTVTSTGNITLGGAISGFTELNMIRSLGTTAFTNGTNPNITTAEVMAEIEADGGFDSYSSVFKTSWSYAGNYNLTDAGDFTETAGSSWITWTDNSSDTTRGNITTLAIAPNTGSSAGGVFIYNDQGSGYAPGWRQVWTSTTDGSGSGLDADLLDAQQGSYYLDWNNFTNKPTIPSVGNGQIDGRTSGLGISGSMDATANQTGNTTFTVTSNAVEAATASTLVYRNSSADINARLFRSNYQTQSTISGSIAFRVNTTDNYIRFCNSPSAIRTFLGVPASGDLGNYLPLAGGIMSGNIGRNAHNKGYFVGGYNNVSASNTSTNPIFTIGTSYLPAVTTLGNMYGIGYTRADASFMGVSSGSGWGMYVASDGNARVFLDGSTGKISTTGAISASSGSLKLEDYNLISTVGLNLKVDSGNVSAITIDNVGSTTFSGYTYFPNYLFHAGDTNTRIGFTTGTVTVRGDTSILLDGPVTANSTVNISSTLTTNAIQANGAISLKDRITLPASSLSSVSGRPGYAIYQEGGAWSSPYPDLCIAMHTGIKFGAYAGYNGMRFYDDYTMATQVMSINNTADGLGAGQVYVNDALQAGSSLRAPIFYDSVNTAYYGDFGSTTYGKYFGRLAHAEGFQVGSYNNVGSNSAKSNPIYTIGSSYMPTETGLSNMYGIGYAHSNFWGSGKGEGWGLYVANAGGFDATIGCEGGVSAWFAGIALAEGSFRAPIFYDSLSTSYFVDPGSTSNVVVLRSEALGTNTSGSQSNQNGLSLYGAYSGGQPTYGMLFSGISVNGAFGGVNTDWATYFTMNGTTGRGWVFKNVSSGSPVASITNLGWAQFAASVRTPIFYDSDNTAYYGNFASTSQLNVLNCAGTLTVTGAGGVIAPKFTDYNNGSFYLDPSSTGTSLNVAGDVVAYASSDIRFKNNITPITNALDKINKIGGYTFEWNEKSHKETGKKDIGVIAQEVEEILPEIVDTRDNGYKAVDYSKLTAFLIQSVKEQQVIIDSLKSRIETLENN